MRNKYLNWSYIFVLLLLSFISVESFEYINDDDDVGVPSTSSTGQSNKTCRNPLLSSSDCSQYSCINFGHNYLESVSDDELSCICPPGIYGTHCEPVNCPLNDMTYTSPKSRSLNFLITYNALMKKMDYNDSYDQFINELVTMIGDSSNGYTSYVGGASCVQKTTLWYLQSFDTNNVMLKNALQATITIMRKFSSAYTNFYIDDILSIVSASEPYSDVNIFTNMGISDDLTTIDSKLSLIKQIAFANRLRIHIFVVSQISPSTEISDQPSWKPILDLSDLTGGFVIEPYDRFSVANSENSTVTKSIEIILPILNNGRTVLKTSIKSNKSGQSLQFKMNVNLVGNRVGYLFVSSIYPFNSSSIQIIAPGASVTTYFELLKLKIFKFSFPSSNNAPFILINNNLNFTLSAQILSTNKDSTIDIGYTINDLADSSSPLPLISVPNTVVARTNNIEGNISLSITTTSNVSAVLTSIGRNYQSCYFNKPLQMIESTEQDVSYFTITSDTGDFQEWIPFTFADKSITPYVRNFYFMNFDTVQKYIYLLENELIFEIDYNYMDSDMNKFELSDKSIDANGEDISMNDESQQQSSTLSNEATTPSPLDTSSQTTFALAIYSRTKLVDELINQPKARSLITKLTQYFAKFESNYNSYIFAPFYQVTNPDKIEAINSDTYMDFMTDMLQRLGTPHDSDVCFKDNSVQEALIKIIQNPNFKRGSDIYLITDQLYDSLPYDKNYGDVVFFELLNKFNPRINILLVEDVCQQVLEDLTYSGLQPYWDLTKKTGGAIIRVEDSNSLLSWFTYLITQSTSKYETIYSDNQSGKYTLTKESTNSFLLTSGHSYTVWGTVQSVGGNNLPTKISIIDSANNTVCSGVPDVLIEQEFGISSPCNITNNDRYKVQLDSNYFPSDTFQVRVSEFNPEFGFKLTFKDSTNKPSNSPIYGVSNPFDILIRPYNDIGLTDTITDLSITIFDGTQKAIFNSTTTKNGDFSYSTTGSWLCNNFNKMYYIQINTQSQSRMLPFICLDKDGGSAPPTLAPGSQCPPWLNASDCSTPVCANGGSLIVGICSCTPDFTGPYCEHYINQCINDEETYYNDYTTSFIVIIDLQSDKLSQITSQFSTIGDDLPYIKEFILLTYDSGNEALPSNMNIFVSSDRKKFINLFYNLQQAPIGSVIAGDHKKYLEAAISRQTGSKSVVLWFPHLWKCDTAPDMTLADLIMKNNVDLRMIYLNSGLEYCQDIGYYLLLGNGLFTKTTLSLGSDDESLSFYVNNALLSLSNSTGLVVYDSYFNYDSSSCNDVPVTIINDGIDGVFVTIDGFSLDSTKIQGLQQLTTFIYYIDMTGINSLDVTFTCLTTTTFRRGYIIEAQSPTKIAFGFNNNIGNSFKNFAPVINPTNTLFFNVEVNEGKDNEFINYFPSVSSQTVTPKNVTLDPNLSFVSRRDSCTNKWVAAIDCSGVSQIDTINKFKISGTTNSGKKYSKVVTVACRNKIVCQNNGTYSNGVCDCLIGWYGQDCSIPTCYNGYQVNNQQCVCNLGYSGSQCGDQGEPLPTVITTTAQTTTTVVSETTTTMVSETTTTIGSETTTAVPESTTGNTQSCYDKLNITLIFLFDQTIKSTPYVGNYSDFYTTFSSKIQIGEGANINIAAVYMSEYTISISFTDSSSIPKYITLLKSSDTIGVKRTFNNQIKNLLTLCDNNLFGDYCNGAKNKYFITFASSNNYVDDNCVANNIPSLTGVKNVVFTFGDSIPSTSWWNTCYETETNVPQQNIIIHDTTKLTTSLFDTAMEDICRFENIV
uniref:EGF-like domain-containing protein n=1 Tax=Parastrongyloides trichosuri TaxID=131310 RepID=A0A0N5A5X0_PARTI